MDNTFLDTLVEYPAKALQKIGTNQTVVSLLTNIPNIDMESDEADAAFDKYLFDYGYVDSTTSEASAYICIEAEFFKSSTATIKDMKLYATIVCHKQFMDIDTSKFKGMIGNRRDNLTRYVDSLLNESDVFGIGKLTLETCRVIPAPTGFAARELVIKYQISRIGKMYFDYFDMLSGEPLLLQGVGHIKSPLLRDICPSSGIGYKDYNLYLNFLSWGKEHLLKYDKIMQYRGASMLDREQFGAFDIATLLKPTREIYRGVLSFFIVEEVVWDEANRRFAICVDNEEDTDKLTVVGEINRENFDDVRRIILQANFIGLDKDEAPTRHSSDKSKELWERAQRYLAEQAKSAEGNEEKTEYRIGNIISKLCAAHPSYNLFNIFNLTIFQLYDSFFQFGYLRSSDLNERIFSNHGGDKFKFEDWLKPIINNM